MKGILILLCSLVIHCCIQHKDDTLIKMADYDPGSHTLVIDYAKHPDTSLLQIIALSGIRKSGYGILLNIDNRYSQALVDTLSSKFRRLDINAIHSFIVFSDEPVSRKISVALEGARFIWLPVDQIGWQTKPIGQIISTIQSQPDDKILIVTDKN